MVKGIKKSYFDLFTKDMWKKLKEGEKKYGTSFKTDNLVEELKSEAIDICNYAYMLYLKAARYGVVIEKLEILNKSEKIIYIIDGKKYILNNSIKKNGK